MRKKISLVIICFTFLLVGCSGNINATTENNQGIYYENSMPLGETYYHLIIFDHLNDVTLQTGSELFDQQLHLSEAALVEGINTEEDLTYQLPTDDTAVQEFLVALYEGTFLDPSDAASPSLDVTHTYTLSFIDSIGLTTNILIYEEGYVAMEQRGYKPLMLQVDALACKNIIEQIRKS